MIDSNEGDVGYSGRVFNNLGTSACTPAERVPPNTVTILNLRQGTDEGSALKIVVFASGFCVNFTSQFTVDQVRQKTIMSREDWR